MSAMPRTPPPTLSVQAETMLTAFGARPDVNADQLTHLRAAINASPAIIQQINGAVASGQLASIRPLPLNTHAGGQYSPADKAMEIPLGIMTSPARGHLDRAELTYVLGHEIQHAINQPGLVAARTGFVDEMKRISAAGNAVNDYTAPAAALIAANRRDEAGAQIGGWNATVDMVRAAHATPSLEDIYRASPGRMQRYIDITPGTPPTYAGKPGVTLNADMSMSATPQNVEAMGRAFFDQPASQSRLGHHGNSNYTNIYALDAVNFIAWHETNFARPLPGGAMPQVRLDMARLGFSEAIIEQNGLALGGRGTRLPYLDSSTSPPTQARFDHTLDTHRHVPMAPSASPAVPGGGGTPAPAGPTPTPAPEATHPAVRQALEAIDRSPNIAADAFGTDRQRVAAGLAVHAAGQGIVPDHVVLDQRGTGLIAVQGALSDPGARLSTPLAVADAARTDPAEALRQLQGTSTHGVQDPAMRMPAPVQAASAQDASAQDPARSVR